MSVVQPEFGSHRRTEVGRFKCGQSAIPWSSLLSASSCRWRAAQLSSNVTSRGSRPFENR